MILVFGGAYQGKTDYAQRLAASAEPAGGSGLAEGAEGASLAAAGNEAVEAVAPGVCDLSGGGEPDFSRRIITGLDAFALRCVEKGQNPVDYFRARREEWAGCLLVMTDISQGVVPIDKTLRAAREANGRLMIYLAEEADQVHRVFCGIGKRIK